MLGLFSKKWNPDGKHCYVTGGSQGLGLSVAKFLARQGANVSIVARDQTKLDKALKELEAERQSPNQKFHAYSFALDTATASTAALEAVCQSYNGEAPDATFTCAGAARPGFFVESTEEDLTKGMTNGYWIQAWTAWAVSKRMVRQKKKGKITFVSSTLGYMSFVGYSSYSPAKHALRGLADTLHSEMLLYGIDVHIFFPPTMYTPGYEEENKSKPKITLKIEESDDGLTPDQAAMVLIKAPSLSYPSSSIPAMTSTIDPKTIGRPKRARRHVRTLTGYLPETDATGKEVWPKGDEKVWKAGMRGVDQDVSDITKSFVNHVQTSLARQAYNLDNLGAYQAAALSVRDSLLVNWNETQLNYTRKTPKRAYYLSLEFLMGRTLDNALLNLGLKDKYRKGIEALGFNMEDILEKERDAALGNGGLGRLAACYLDSGASQELPLWGYGLRYQYGIFQQLISPEGNQLEAPDPWLENQNPWELPRLDVTYEVRFYGQAERNQDGNGRATWTGGQEVLAVAYDVMIPGYKTKTTNNLRLWESRPKRGFDLNSFNAGNYEGAVESSNSAAAITSVLYPNDSTTFGKELRLKQQYFWTAASLQDILRRFKNTGKPIAEFPDCKILNSMASTHLSDDPSDAAIQLNDTHPTLAIPELMRILIDEEELSWDEAWKIVNNTFFYTNHTVLPEALEKWPVPLVEHVLPRHMQIIYDINLYFLQAVEKKFPGDRDRLARMSLIEEGYPKQVRMAHLACIGSRKVNGVAELHSDLVKTTILKDFVEFEGVSKFGNVTNGVTPRRWLDQCNVELSDLITKTLKVDKNVWLKDLTKLEGLLPFAENKKFREQWAAIKQRNKERLAHHVQSTLGLTVRTDAMFDVQIKRLHEYKRQTLNILGVIHRYLTLKGMSPAERKKSNRKVVFFAGKAAPAYYIAKLTIRLIVNVARVINADPDTKDYLQLYFLPDYSVSLAEVLIPASDISQHISTAGTEASGTSNMKFCLNGGLLLGTVDGANIEIAEEVGESNVFFFGHLTPAVEDLRYQHTYHPVPIEQKCPGLAKVLDQVSAGLFGDGAPYEPLLNTIRQGDYYLLTDDFDSYIAALAMVDEAYLDRDEWIKKSIRTTAKMGKFSSDRAILEYAESYWNLEPTSIA
ncbi:hypothetical protein D9756_007833 [Leucocoprinus leucothites]|uniref:Alpha-1,4 glucan phosphorylase n=1 Tax=Leucocoprinus leucothites TaxID=201217 RepID=A0A8H5D798_9AGAR|nr:hypothetical protein D9756_007833 [Leucoagaricus leucothites]